MGQLLQYFACTAPVIEMAILPMTKLTNWLMQYSARHYIYTLEAHGTTILCSYILANM